MRYFWREIKLSKSIKNIENNFFRKIVQAIKNTLNIEVSKQNKNITEKDLFKNIVETIRSTLDIDVTKNTIIKTLGENFKADRCFIIEYDKKNDNFLILNNEYLSSSDIISYKGTCIDKNIPTLSKEFKKGKCFVVSKGRAELDGKSINLDDGNFEEDKKAIKKYEVKSAIIFPLNYLDEFLGDLVFHYVKEEKVIGEKEIDTLNVIANQIAIALHQAELYEETKQTKNKLNAILDNIPYWAWIKDKEGKYLLVNKEYAKDKNVTIQDFIGKTDYDFYPNEIAEKYLNDDKEVMVSKELKTIKEEETVINEEKRYLETFKQPFLDNQGEVIGTIGIAKDITEKKEVEAELIQRQEKIIKANKREILLRNITEKIRSSLDIDETLTFICEEIAKLFNVQRVNILQYTDQDSKNWLVLRKEYKTSYDILGYEELKNKLISLIDIEELYKIPMDIFAINNVLESDYPQFFKEVYGGSGIKAIMGVPIKKGDDIWGLLNLSEYNSPRHWGSEEKELLNAIASQVYIAINQAELYENQKNMAERERISKNIIEILRSSIDKTTIKKLFVKNIGKFFNADRVFFTEYDDNEKIFMPTDKDSEYLSDSNEKSFIGVDWSKHSIREYFNAILEKREVKIFSIEEYIKDKQLNGEIKSLLDDANIKSNYSFPVFYQDKIIGSFCIDFTKETVRLSDEDINRIRNMCTQAGIALYHAEMLSKAQELAGLKNSCIKNMTDAINELTDNLTKLSEEISKMETKCENCSLYLNYLNEITTRISNFVNEVKKHADSE